MYDSIIKEKLVNTLIRDIYVQKYGEEHKKISEHIKWIDLEDRNIFYEWVRAIVDAEIILLIKA